MIANLHKLLLINVLILTFTTSVFAQTDVVEKKKKPTAKQQDEGFSNSDLKERKKEKKAKKSKEETKKDGKTEKKKTDAKESKDKDAKAKKDAASKKESKDKDADKKAASSKGKAGDSKKADTKTSKVTKDAKKKKVEKKTKVRQISLSGSYVDLVQPVSFDPTSLILGGSPAKQRSFYKLCKFLEDFEENEQFKHVVFDLSAGVSMNSAQLDELTRRLEKLGESGKKLYAWLENASNVQMAIAACCDEVFLADLGSVDMPSMAMQSIFYKDAMDLVGVKASVVRAGDFKGAVEPYVNPKMSTHLREHYVQMLETMNDALIDRLAKGRGLKHADIRKLQAKRALLPKDALAAGIVDELAPYGSMKETISDKIGDDVEWITAKQAAKRQVNMFQLMGQMMSGPTSSRSRLRGDTIAVLHLSGAIVDGKKAVGGSIVSGPTVDLVNKLIEEEKIKGVVVRVNSPGGSATASEAVRQALVRLAEAKPTVVSMGNMAASGGYWISCIDAPVYAEKGTLTGSIGVFSMKLSAGALMRRVGVNMEAITLDDSAAIFAMDRPWNESDNESLQEMIDFIYDKFLALVSDARGIKLKKLRKLAGGRVWSGTQAKQNKLVDQLGGVDDCVAFLAKKAKLEDYKVIHRPIARSGLDLSDLLSSGGEEEIWSGISKATLQLLERRGLSLETTRLLLRDGLTNDGLPTVWALSPIEFSIR